MHSGEINHVRNYIAWDKMLQIIFIFTQASWSCPCVNPVALELNVKLQLLSTLKLLL